jgi:hypothetical protein
MTRGPWYIAAWLLLVAAFGFGVFDLYAPAALLLAASVAAYVVALRKAKPASADGRASESPHQ